MSIAKEVRLCVRRCLEKKMPHSRGTERDGLFANAMLLLVEGLKDYVCKHFGPCAHLPRPTLSVSPSLLFL